MLRHRTGGGRVRTTTHQPTTYGYVEVALGDGMPESYPDTRSRSGVRQSVWIHDLTPRIRPDGLVLVRPDDEEWEGPEGDLAERDDPMYENYHWVAMLDPRELGAGVDLSDVREVTHHGRRAWAARCVPTEGYDPRCGCCPLLWCEVSDRDEYGDPDDPAAWTPTETYPEAYDVVLDHATGFVVGITPLGPTSRGDLALDVEIHASS